MYSLLYYYIELFSNIHKPEINLYTNFKVSHKLLTIFGWLECGDVVIFSNKGHWLAFELKLSSFNQFFNTDNWIKIGWTLNLLWSMSRPVDVWCEEKSSIVKLLKQDLDVKRLFQRLALDKPKIGLVKDERRISIVTA